MKFGLIEAIKSGIRFTTANNSNYVGLKPPAVAPATSFDITLLNALPVSVQALTIDNTGAISTAALGSGGSVSSIGISAPSDILTVGGSPVTTSGTISLTKVSQSANLVYASPNGASGNPVFRSLVAADIPKTLDNTWISNFDLQVRTSRLDQLSAPTANININGQKLTGLSDPVGLQDAATKNYVDATAQGLDIKASVRVASTGNINVSSPGTAIDGVTLVVNDRVLLKNQSTNSENGIYIWNGSAVAMIRSADMDSTNEFPGAFTFVEEGTVNSDTGWVCTTNAPITIGTTSIGFTQFSGAGSFIDGAGLLRTGNTLDVIGTLNRILVNADSVDISPNYIGQSSITSVGTITTGVWNGSTIGIGSGGTGAISAVGARTNLGVPGVTKGTFNSSNLTSNILTISHSYNTSDLSVEIRDSTGRIIPDSITFPNNMSINIDLSSYNTPAAITGTWGYIISG